MATSYTAHEVLAQLRAQGERIMDPPVDAWMAAVVTDRINVWLGRGDGVAVYVNEDLGHRDAGDKMFVSYGSAMTQLESDTPPDQLPDGVNGTINWRYKLAGFYQGEPLPLNGLELGEGYVPWLFTVAMDNHEPAKRVETGTLWAYVHKVTGTPGYKIKDASLDLFKDAGKLLFLIDDGSYVIPHYVSGWNQDGSYVHIQPFPTNPEGRARPDNGRLIDFSDWMLGPRRAYHLKISKGY